MNRLSFFLVLISSLFLGCNDNNDNTQIQSNPPKRTITQDDIDSLKYVTVCCYDIGWNILTLSSTDNYFDPEGKILHFFIDIDKKGKIKEGTYECKNTESFKRYAGFKCNNVDYEPNDVIIVTKNADNNYTISFSYMENDQLFQGTHTGIIDYVNLAIDYHKDCY